MSSRPSSCAVALVALVSGYLHPAPVLAQWTQELVPTKNPQPQALAFTPALSRVRYRQEQESLEFNRASGQEKGRVHRSNLRSEFQVSIWEVPSGSGILRVETQALGVGSKVEGHVQSADISDFPVSVKYMRRDGYPSNYTGHVLDDQLPTALVFPSRPVRPGDTWKRLVAPSNEFEIPTQCEFTYLREGRMGGRLVAEIGLKAEAKGALPHGRGDASLQVSATFVFDIRLGRVIHTRSRLFQTLNGPPAGGRPPARTKLEQTIELWAVL